MIIEALGGIIGAFINARLPARITSKYSYMILLLCGMGGTLLLPALIGDMTNLVVCLLPFFAFGLLLTMYNINFMSYVQENVTEEYLGRVFSIIFTVAVIFMPFGSLFFTKLGIVKSVRGFSIPGTGIVVLATISSIIRKYI